MAARENADWQVRIALDLALQNISPVDASCTDWERIGRQEPTDELRARVRKELAKPDKEAQRCTSPNF